MNRWLARFVKAGALFTSHYSRRLRDDSFPGVAVLCYHGIRNDKWSPGRMIFEGLHVRAAELEAHCRFIQQTCHPISLADWRAALAGGPPLPARPVLVTFDDGYSTVFTLARPILQRYAIPAVVFVCSEPVETRRLLWYDAVARAWGETEAERIKALPFDEWKRLSAEWSQPVSDDDPHAHLTIEAVRSLANTPGIEIGSHTVSHAILARATLEQQREQITCDKARLEAWTGGPVTAFAYPNGQPGEDYTSETVRLVKESGFEIAFTTANGFATPSEEPLERSRFLMLAGISAAELAHRLSYSWRR
jgi:peptidoglycan/xylan/chitin deacetylase (PgdA/CDA1 family)